MASIGGKDFSPELRSAEAAGVERQQIAARLDQLALWAYVSVWGYNRSCLAGSVRGEGLAPSYSGAGRAGFSYELQVLANEPALPPFPSNRVRLPVSTLGGLHVKAARKSTVEKDMRVRMPEQLRNAETVCDAERETAFYRARADARTTGHSHDLERTAEMKPSDFRGDEE